MGVDKKLRVRPWKHNIRLVIPPESISDRIWKWIERLTYVVAILGLPYALFQLAQSNRTDTQIGELLGYTEGIYIEVSKLDFYLSDTAAEIFTREEREELVAASINELNTFSDDVGTSLETLSGNGDPPQETFPETIIFEDDFNSQSIDRDKWIVRCQPSNLGVLEGKLSYTSSDDDDEYCTVLAELPDASQVKRVEFDMTIQPGTNSFGYIGLFAVCGDRILDVLGHSTAIEIVKETQAPKVVELVYQLPYETHVTIEFSNEIVNVTTQDLITSEIKNSSTTCFSKKIEVSLGTQIRNDLGGMVSGTIDNLVIWGTKEGD